MTDHALIYDVQELHERTDEVLAEITASGRPAGIVNCGRFVARILPTDDSEVMAAVLSSGPLRDELDRRAADGNYVDLPPQ